MPNLGYLKGRRFELKVRSAFEENGFVVVRSAGSRGPIDLVALKRGAVYLISCRSGAGKLGPVERTELLMSAVEAGFPAVLAYRVDHALRLQLLTREGVFLLEGLLSGYPIAQDPSRQVGHST